MPTSMNNDPQQRENHNCQALHTNKDKQTSDTTLSPKLDYNRGQHQTTVAYRTTTDY